ncbi:hypothetical protein CRG98_016534, partial [Punica granatum]
MDEENVYQVPRGLTLEEAQFLGFQQMQEELFARLDRVTQTLEPMAVALLPLQHAHRVPRRNVRVKDEADQEDELLKEEEQLVPRRQQKGVGKNLKLKIPQFKGTSSPEEYLEWVQRVDKGGIFVEDYVMEFEMLSMRYKLTEPREQTIARFISGLNKEIADIVELQPYLFLEDLIKLAVVVSSVDKRSSSKWNAQQKEVGASHRPQAEATKGKEKHTDSQRPVRSRDIKYFKCLGFGHIASECTNQRVMTIQSSLEIKSEDEGVDEEVSEGAQEEN